MIYLVSIKSYNIKYVFDTLCETDFSSSSQTTTTSITVTQRYYNVHNIQITFYGRPNDVVP